MFRDLLDGYGRFRDGLLQGGREFLTKLAHEGQSPDALYVGCSDSRVVPELLTTSSPGRLFVVRNIANQVPPLAHADASVGAALDYAVAYLHVSHVVVCGHSACGGIGAVLAGLDHLPPEAESLRAWLEPVVEAVQRADAEEPLDAAARLKSAIEWNVLIQLSNLLTFPLVAEAVVNGHLKLHGWVYDLHTQELAAYDAATGRFQPVDRLISVVPDRAVDG
jgi:carbonic anhydrase